MAVRRVFFFLEDYIIGSGYSLNMLPSPSIFPLRDDSICRDPGCNWSLREAHWNAWPDSVLYGGFNFLSAPCFSVRACVFVSERKTISPSLSFLMTEPSSSWWREFPPVRAVQALGVGACPLLHPARRKLHTHELSCQLSKVSTGTALCLIYNYIKKKNPSLWSCARIWKTLTPLTFLIKSIRSCLNNQQVWPIGNSGVV